MKKSKRRNYDAEFKRNAVKLASEPGRTASGVEQSLGIPNGMIYRWRKQLETMGELAFPGKGIEALTEEQIKIRELEKQLKEITLERDILKKAVAIFSKAQK